MSSKNKRKGAESPSEPTAKKMRTSASSERKIAKKSKSTAAETAPTDLPTSIPPPKTKKGRKTAADFLSDDDNAQGVLADQQEVNKKSKLPKQRKSESSDPAPAKETNSEPPLRRESGTFERQFEAYSVKKAEKAKAKDEAEKLAAQALEVAVAEKADEAAPQKSSKKSHKTKTKTAHAVNGEKLEEEPTKKKSRKLKAASKMEDDQKIMKSGETDNAQAPIQEKMDVDQTHKKSGDTDTVEAPIEEKLDGEKIKKKSNKTKTAEKTKADQKDEKLAKDPVDDFEGFDDAGDAVDTVDTVANADGAALLQGFDSDTPDDAEDVDLTLRETPPITDPEGKVEKSLRDARRKAGPDDEPGTIYVGRIPHGFFEVQMRAFFSQFGDITRLRLSRNRHTGASKHFAFIEFASAEVAKIAAKTMDGYLMFGHILKSKFAPAESLHADVWKGANKKFHKLPHNKLDGQKLAEPKSVEQWESKKTKEESRRKKKAKTLKDIGYDMPESSLVAPKKSKKNTDDVAASRQLLRENGDSSKLEESENDEPAASTVTKTKTMNKAGTKKTKEGKEGKKRKRDPIVFE